MARMLPMICEFCPNNWRFPYAWSAGLRYGKGDYERRALVARARSLSDIPADLQQNVFPGFIYKDEQIAIFADIDNDAPTHWLILPIEHIDDLHILQRPELLHIVYCAAEQIVELSGAEEAYISISTKKDGTSYFPHTHMQVQSQTLITNLALEPYFYRKSKYFKS